MPLDCHAASPDAPGPAPAASLDAPILRGGALLFGRQVVGAGLAFFGMLALARLLGPADERHLFHRLRHRLFRAERREAWPRRIPGPLPRKGGPGHVRPDFRTSRRARAARCGAARCDGSFAGQGAAHAGTPRPDAGDGGDDPADAPLPRPVVEARARTRLRADRHRRACGAGALLRRRDRGRARRHRGLRPGSRLGGAAGGAPRLLLCVLRLSPRTALERRPGARGLRARLARHRRDPDPEPAFADRPPRDRRLPGTRRGRNRRPRCAAHR